jgi:hypothetical protein
MDLDRPRRRTTSGSRIVGCGTGAVAERLGSVERMQTCRPVATTSGDLSKVIWVYHRGLDVMPEWGGTSGTAPVTRPSRASGIASCARGSRGRGPGSTITRRQSTQLTLKVPDLQGRSSAV